MYDSDSFHMMQTYVYADNLRIMLFGIGMICFGVIFAWIADDWKRQLDEYEALLPPSDAV
jgi:hypothetical protein